MRNDRSAWEVLRASRSALPGRAGDTTERRQVFGSALEQAEQFFKAASAVGPETQPVLIFYGLSQAGRAIAAASALDGKDKKALDLWKLKGHGISTRSEAGPLPEVVVETGVPDSSGSFVRLSGLLHSPVWEKDRVTLAQLWDSLPDNYHSPLGQVPEARRMPLYVEVRSSPWIREESRRGERRWMLSAPVANFPPHVIDAADQARALDEYLEAFPHVHGRAYPTRTIVDHAVTPPLRSGPPDLKRHDDGWCEIHMSLPVSPDDDSPQGRLRQLRGITRRYRGEHYLFPAVGQSARGIHPLMAWWAILHTLSTISRYQPAEWGRHIDVDRSSHAVPVERLLRAAIQVVPQLIAETLGEVTR